MRLRLVLALLAATALTACGQPAAQKGANSARAPIGAATPATAAASQAAPQAPHCPTVAPACPPARVAAAGSRSHAVRKAPARREARAVAKAAPVAGRSYARAEQGLPPRPYRYEDLPREPQEDGAYAGPAYRHHHWHDDGRRAYAYRERDDGADGAERDVPPPPPLERREDRYGHREGRYEREAPPPPAPGWNRYQRYERHEQASSSYRAFSDETVEGPCCGRGRVEAAGFDARGFLTWPGKVPAR